MSLDSEENVKKVRLTMLSSMPSYTWEEERVNNRWLNGLFMFNVEANGIVKLSQRECWLCIKSQWIYGLVMNYDRLSTWRAVKRESENCVKNDVHSNKVTKKILTESKAYHHMFDQVYSFYRPQCNHLGIVHISFHSKYHDMSHLIFEIKTDTLSL